MPPAFREEPFGLPKGRIRVGAVVGDLVESLAGRAPEKDFLRSFVPAEKSAAERNRLLWVLAASHLLWHPAFRERGAVYPQNWHRRFFVQELSMLAGVAQAEKLVTDEERREELIRRALGVLELRLPGESDEESRDRLTQVDSLERQRILSEVAKRQAKLRREEELRRKAAEEAASKMPRE